MEYFGVSSAAQSETTASGASLQEAGASLQAALQVLVPSALPQPALPPDLAHQVRYLLCLSWASLQM